MRTPNPYLCDVCHRQKGEANKWLLGFAIVSQAPAGNVALMASGTAIGYAIVTWTNAIADSPLVHHLCSDTCALKKQAEYIRP
jgi:hypothetical protein